MRCLVSGLIAHIGCKVTLSLMYSHKQKRKAIN